MECYVSRGIVFHFGHPIIYCRGIFVVSVVAIGSSPIGSNISFAKHCALIVKVAGISDENLKSEVPC